MSRSGLSKKSTDESIGFMQKYNQMASAPNVFRMGPGPNKSQLVGGDNANVNFPVKLGATHPKDMPMQLMKNSVNESGVVPGVGINQVGPDFWQYAKEKEDMQNMVNFKQWMMQQANLTTPEASQWWFDRFKWMKDLREEEIDYQSDLQSRLAKIQVRGPQDEDDWMLLYMKEQGFISVADKPVHLLGEATNVASTYTAGFFSPLSKTPIPNQPKIDNAKISWANPNAQGTKAGFQINQQSSWRNILGNARYPATTQTPRPFSLTGVPENLE